MKDPGALIKEGVVRRDSILVGGLGAFAWRSTDLLRIRGLRVPGIRFRGVDFMAIKGVELG